MSEMGSDIFGDAQVLQEGYQFEELFVMCFSVEVQDGNPVVELKAKGLDGVIDDDYIFW